MAMNFEQNLILESALEFQKVMRNNGWKFCYIGGLAVLRWGNIRMTQDVDVCLECGFGSESKYIPGILDTFESRLTEPKEFAAKNRVLLIKTANGIPVDISLSGLAFEEEMIERATFFEFAPAYSLLTCSAEDLIILKTFADRPKDWMDVEGIIARQKNNLAKSLIMEQLTPLCAAKDSSTIILKLEKMFSQFE